MAIVTLIALLPVSSAPAQDRSTVAPLEVEWKDRRLTVSATEAPLSTVLREVAHRVGIEIRGLEGLPGSVSIEIRRLPLAEGLQRLLAHVDHVIVEEKSAEGGSHPASVLIFGRLETPVTGEDGPPALAPVDGTLTAEPITSEGIAVQTHDERVAELLPADLQGTATDDESKTQRPGRDSGGTRLDDEQRAARPRQADGEGVALEDEGPAQEGPPNAGGIQMDDERAAEHPTPDR